MIIYLFIGLVLGIFIMFFLMQSQIRRINQLAPENQDEIKKKQNLAKIESYIIDKDKFTNDDLQDLLGVSNSTIKRYLDELENADKIQQVGAIGAGVYYIKR